jgi:hypothetical protein
MGAGVTMSQVTRRHQVLSPSTLGGEDIMCTISQDSSMSQSKSKPRIYTQDNLKLEHSNENSMSMTNLSAVQSERAATNKF